MNNLKELLALGFIKPGDEKRVIEQATKVAEKHQRADRAAFERHRVELTESLNKLSRVEPLFARTTLKDVEVHPNTFAVAPVVEEMCSEIGRFRDFMPHTPTFQDSDVESAGRMAMRGVKGFYVWGNSGNGKTLSTCGMLNHLREKYHVAGQCVNFLDLMFDLRSHPTMSERMFEISQAASRLSKTPVLVLDDLDNITRMPDEIDLLYTVLNRRMQAQLPIIVTANVPLEGLGEKFCDTSKTDGLARFTRLKSFFRAEIHLTGENLREGPANGNTSPNHRRLRSVR